MFERQSFFRQSNIRKQIVTFGFITTFASVSLMAQLASAQSAKPLDSTTQESVQKTQDLLRDQKRLEQEGLLTPEAKQNHEKIKGLTGSDADTALIYSLGADIFGDLAKETGGDPIKMMELMNKYMSKPEAFAHKLTPDQRQRIQELAKKIESRKPGSTK